VDISENSENNLKAIVGRLEMAERDRPTATTGKVAEKAEGNDKETKISSREWHSAVASADSMELQERNLPVSSLSLEGKLKVGGSAPRKQDKA
jgi:hypothetical protein